MKVRLDFVKAFQEYNDAFASILVYSDFDPTILDNKIFVTRDELKEYEGRYNNVKESLKT